MILDTTVLVAAERASTPLDDVVADEDDVSIAAVTAAELLVGVELASRARRDARAAYVESLLSTLPVEPYDMDVARSHAELLVHVQRSGRARGAHDLLIAATAVARGKAVVTADVGGFEELPGVELRALS